MLTEDQITAGMGSAMDQIEAMVRDHEESNHGGKCCPLTRLSTMAFVAHRLGMRTDMPSWVIEFQVLLRKYEAACPNCTHGENE